MAALQPSPVWVLDPADPRLPSSLFMWVQPEITQKLYIALWAAFLASCFFPYRLVGLAVGKETPPQLGRVGSGAPQMEQRTCRASPAPGSEARPYLTCRFGRNNHHQNLER